MIRQITFRLSAKRRGCHLVTSEILEHLPKPLPQTGLLNLFVQHTSCALSINENADPDVRTDMEKILNHLVPENEPYYDHTLEGLEIGADRQGYQQDKQYVDSNMAFHLILPRFVSPGPKPGHAGKAAGPRICPGDCAPC